MLVNNKRILFFYQLSDHAEPKPILSFIGDICEPEAIEKAFEGVDCVFHCAAFVNFQFPPDLTELERVNVNGKFCANDFPIVIKIEKIAFPSGCALCS